MRKNVRSLCLGLAGFLAVSLTAPFAMDAAASPEVCESGKIKESGKYAFCRLKTVAKALKKDLAADFTKCDASLSKKWNKLEDQADGACPTSDDLESVRTEIIVQTGEIQASLEGTGQGAVAPDVLCQSQKLVAAGKFAQCRMKAAAKAVKKGTVSDPSSCDAPLQKSWEKAEQKADGACPTAGDVSVVSSLVSAQTGDIISTLGGGGTTPVCGNRVVDAGEMCDGDAPGGACGAGQCTDTCQCKVCCELNTGSAPNTCLMADSEFECASLTGAGTPWTSYTVGSSDSVCASGRCTVAPTPGDCCDGSSCSTGLGCTAFGTVDFQNATCTANGCEGDPVVCQPSCGTNQICGDDGCGGTCGASCPAETTCANNGTTCCRNSGVPCTSGVQCCSGFCDANPNPFEPSTCR